MLYPRQTARVAGPHNVHGAHTGAWCKELFEAGVEYLLVDERDLAKATVSGGNLIVGGLAYRALVLPAISHLANARTLEVIAQFVAAGGIVVASGPLVAHVYDDTSGAPVARAAKLLKEVLHFAEAPDAPAIQALAAKLTPDLPIRSPSPAPATLRQWRGRDSESSRLVLFNDGREPLRVAIGLGSKPVSLERWRPESGAVEPWAWVAVGDAGAETIIVLQPNELFCLRSAAATKREGRVVATSGSLDRFGRTPDGRLTASLTFRTGETPEVDLAAEAKPRVTAAGKDVQVHALSAGQWRAAPPVMPGSPVILSDGWTLRAGEGAAVPIAVDRGWEQQGFDAFSGVGVYEVEFAVTAAQAAVTWELVLPAVHTTASATLNGTAIGTRIACPYRLQISANTLRIGSNRLVIEVRNTAGNRYYANTPYRGPVADPSGLAAAPRLAPITPMTVEF